MTNNARVGGILSVVSGGLGCLGTLIIVFFAILVGVYGGSTNYQYNYDYSRVDNVALVVAVIYGVFAFIGLIISILAIVGGVFGIRKKNWGLALAGSIASSLSFFPCGIAAIIFTTLGKAEFNTASPAPPTVPRF
jgi:hypothetical protein